MSVMGFQKTVFMGGPGGGGVGGVSSIQFYLRVLKFAKPLTTAVVISGRHRLRNHFKVVSVRHLRHSFVGNKQC